jgi:effector-binding domain-containing protein
MSSYEIIDTTEQDYLYVTRTCTMKPGEIAKAMGDAYDELWAFMQKNEIPPAGSAIAVYYDYSEDEMEFRVGFFIAPEYAAKAQGSIKADKTPATRAVHAIHTGPYAGLQEAYGKIMGDMQWAGLKYGKPTWEGYLNDPDKTPEAELKTEIFIALA